MQIYTKQYQICKIIQNKYVNLKWRLHESTLSYLSINQTALKKYSH